MELPSWSRLMSLCALVVSFLAPLRAWAQDCDRPTLGGYAEVFGTVTTEHVADGTLQLRGFDNRVNTFSLSNVALSTQVRCGDRARGWGQIGLDVTLQFAGTTAPTYYGSEAGDWRFIQQASFSWRRDTDTARGRYWLVESGVFLSPIGPEGMAVKDNWNWSRSNLFFGLPFYHLMPLRVTRGWSPQFRTTVGVLNGWNDIVDNNDEKTFYIQAVYETARTTASALVMTGVERPGGAPEGRPWRTLIDAHFTFHLTAWFSFQFHVNMGCEPNRFGWSQWGAGALSLRVRPWPTRLPGLTFAVRWDGFSEGTPSGATPIFWPTTPGWLSQTFMSSSTLTVRWEILGHAAVYLEGRGDYTTAQIWVSSRDAVGTPAYMPLRLTGTLGLTAWF